MKQWLPPGALRREKLFAGVSPGALGKVDTALRAGEGSRHSCPSGPHWVGVGRARGTHTRDPEYRDLALGAGVGVTAVQWKDQAPQGLAEI